MVSFQGWKLAAGVNTPSASHHKTFAGVAGVESEKIKPWEERLSKWVATPMSKNDSTLGRFFCCGLKRPSENSNYTWGHAII